MKCNIGGQIVDVRLAENLGYQGGYDTKAVIYKGKEYIVIKEAGSWRSRNIYDKVVVGGGYKGQQR